MNLFGILSPWGSSNYRPSAPFLYEVASHVKNCHFGDYYYYYYYYYKPLLEAEGNARGCGGGDCSEQRVQPLGRRGGGGEGGGKEGKVQGGMRRVTGEASNHKSTRVVFFVLYDNVIVSTTCDARYEALCTTITRYYSNDDIKKHRPLQY